MLAGHEHAVMILGYKHLYGIHGVSRSCPLAAAYYKVHICVYVCVRERERERGCARSLPPTTRYICVRVCVRERERERACPLAAAYYKIHMCACVCGRERERERGCARSLLPTRRNICVRVCGRERERESECARSLPPTTRYICVRETERDSVVCVCVCVFVCVRESEVVSAHFGLLQCRDVCVKGERERQSCMYMCVCVFVCARESEFVLTSACYSVEGREREKESVCVKGERERKKEKLSQKPARCRKPWHWGFPICMCARIWSNRKIDFLQSRLPPNGWCEMKTTFARLSICNENDV